ncbi:MAG: YncE family protein [Rhodothermales bacterium]|nr:YncE family protein [Rhodothermales bacterium]MBO6780064.1 YncE family protein [Rhodothermales bacterium]
MKATLTSALLLVCLLLGCASSAQTVTTVVDTDYIYVCNQGEAKVTVIDAATNEIVDTVDLTELGYPENAKPHHVAVEPDGSYWYLSMISANRVLKFNRDNEVVGTAEFQVPGMLQLSAGDDLLYVGRSMSAVNPPQSIGVIERSTMEVDEVDIFFPRPHALAVTPDGDFVLSASLAENRMIVLDQESGDGVFMELPGEIHSLVQFAIAPDGQSAIAGGELTSRLFFLDLSNAPEVSIRGTIDVGDRPWHPVYAADGRHAFVPNKGADAVTVVDTQEMRVVTVIEGQGMAQPHGSALSADGRFLYVSQQNTGAPMDMSPGATMDHSGHGMVTVIDTATNEIVKVFHIGNLPSGVGSRGVSR